MDETESKLKESSELYYPDYDGIPDYSELANYRYPVDEEGFCVGFDPFSQAQELVDTFRHCGVVVVSNAISEEEADDTVDEVCFG